MRTALLFTTCLLLGICAYCQQPVLVRIVAEYDSSAVPELYNHVPVGLRFVYSDSTQQYTQGFLGGHIRWNRIKVTTADGSFENGYFTFDRRRLAQQQYTATFTITLADAPRPYQVSLTLPHLTGIRFNHYADSLKRDIHFYLNVEGRFSSGKIYPLDTSVVRLRASAGRLLGQDLLLNRSSDSVTRFISVQATVKSDPGLTASSVIPVKQLADDGTGVIEDSRDLYNNRKRKKRN